MNRKHIEYLKTVAYPMEELVKILNENPQSDFTCDKLIETVTNAKDNSATTILNGKEITLSQKDMLKSIYLSYVLSFAVARPTCPIIDSLIKHIHMIDQKLFSPVDPTKQKEFIQDFQTMLSSFSSSDQWSINQYPQAVNLYLNFYTKSEI